jgi:hypothetical protein
MYGRSTDRDAIVTTARTHAVLTYRQSLTLLMSTPLFHAHVLPHSS